MASKTDHLVEIIRSGREMSQPGEHIASVAGLMEVANAGIGTVTRAVKIARREHRIPVIAVRGGAGGYFACTPEELEASLSAEDSAEVTDMAADSTQAERLAELIEQARQIRTAIDELVTGLEEAAA